MMLLSEEDGRIGVSLAREALRAAVLRTELAPPPLPPVFSEKRGVFVTLKQAGELRGCIGIPLPALLLKDAIIEAAHSAALQDPRFMPVRANELPKITVEVTILSIPEEITSSAIERADHVVVGRHGLIVKGRGQSGLLLPQVASEYEWNAVEFLDHTCVKAGLSPGCWRDEQVSVLRFEGQIFSE
ncbi:TIGR00296 family protein [Methanocalculus taiwanensis]|uniref:Protein FTO68_02985 n=1 Tax=Methanocalculus taiwanensis TaxID=106207 RepID=A0ABD4TID9_9EURY|nr:TIGR00296 family protein [Methanocalculus taiwanensis]MCQ1537954.1 TIGR00296 family protein [Methanocalculus taiwanensis]